MRIYRHTDGRFTVAEKGVWIPGVYDTEEAARYAVGLSDAVLQALQQAMNEREADFAKRYLTLDMLKEVSE